MSSAECQAKIDECNNIIKKCNNLIEKVTPLYDYIGSTLSDANNCLPLIESSNTDGSGNVNYKHNIGNIISTLNSLTTSLNIIIAECKAKIESCNTDINTYTNLYQQALEEEKKSNI